MIQFSYTTDKPKQFFVVTFDNNKDIQKKQTVNEIRRNKSNPKSKKYNSSAKKQYNENYSIVTWNDYSYVPFVPASDFFNNKVIEDGSFGTHLYRDCFGRFYDNCCFDNMD